MTFECDFDGVRVQFLGTVARSRENERAGRPSGSAVRLLFSLLAAEGSDAAQGSISTDPGTLCAARRDPNKSRTEEERRTWQHNP